MNFDNYSFFKGEAECPFSDKGRSFWWRVEVYAYDHQDKKVSGELSSTMLSYLKERIWQTPSGWTTSWAEALSRAKYCYKKGVWNAGYITDVNATKEILN